ncbi:MAG: helix-turn-helix domain-containing protein [Candidatus Dormibacteria bacterium]
MVPGKAPVRAQDRELRELVYLQELARAAASTMERDQLLELIIRETTGALEADVCALYLHDQARAGLVLTATNGLNQRAVGKVVMPWGEGVTGQVAASRQPISVLEVASDPRFKWVEGVDEARFTSMLSVPIEAGQRIVGVLNVQTVARRDFRADELAFLSAIASSLAGVLERSQLQHRLELQLEEIRLSQTVHQRFTQLALSGAGLGNILEAISSLAETTVGLYDPLGFRLQHRSDRALGLRRLNVPSGLMGAEQMEAMGSRQGRPPTDLVLAPVRAGGELVAVLAAEGRIEDASPGTRRALEHGATVVALELLKERAEAEVERRVRGDLLDGLLTAGQSADDIARLAIRSERLGYRIPESAWVLVLEPDDERAQGQFQSPPIQERLQRDLGELTQLRFPGALTVSRTTGSVIVVPTQSPASPRLAVEPGAVQLEEFGRAVLALGRGLGGSMSLSLGLGNLAATAKELSRAHEEARQALRLARRGGARAQYVSYRSLGAARLLLEVRDPEVLRRFVDETLGPVLAYARRHRTPLLPSLEALVAQRWNQRAAARQLGIHINTLAYRLQRLEELLGVSLADAENRVLLSVALQARHLLLG